jgi:hypothetical protein
MDLRRVDINLLVSLYIAYPATSHRMAKRLWLRCVLLADRGFSRGLSRPSRSALVFVLGFYFALFSAHVGSEFLY